MFDPTVFDNLKVVLEGSVYDLDDNEDIDIVDRSDLVDLAKMSRDYSISLAKEKVEATIQLTTDIKNWSGEILGPEDETYSCTLFIEFFLKLSDIDHECSSIRFQLNQIWRTFKPKIEQQISFLYGNASPDISDQITVHFQEPIDESFIVDFPRVVSLVMETLNALETLVD